MDDLLNEVPELNLRKTSEKRTVHRNDLSNPSYSGYRAGDVIEMVSYRDSKGNQWTRADVMYFIKMNELMQPQEKQSLVEV